MPEKRVSYTVSFLPYDIVVNGKIVLFMTKLPIYQGTRNSSQRRIFISLYHFKAEQQITTYKRRNLLIIFTEPFKACNGFNNRKTFVNARL